MNINYEYYKIFYYTAKYKSFTKAADALYSNQPNISRTIAKLESELECKLFIRSKNGLILTPEGDKLFQHIQIAHNQIMDGEKELLKRKQLVSGSISIGVTETALNVFLLDKLEIFKKKYPDIHLRITNQSTPQAIKSLDNGSVDLAVVVTPTHLTNTMHQEILFEFEDILTVGKDYKDLSKSIQSIKELGDYPLIMLANSTTTFQFFNQIYIDHSLELNAEIEVETTDQVLPLVKHNLGLGFLPYPFAKESIDKKEIFQVHLKELLPKRHIVFITNTKQPLSLATKQLIDTLKK